MKRFLYVLFLAVAVSACSPYQTAIKSEDAGVKFNEAVRQYEKGKYTKAIRLFEQIAPAYRGKPQAEKMFYLFAMSYYNTEQYYLAGYQFDSFTSSYPKSEKAEEAAYLGAKSYSMLSPVYSLDQNDTVKAISKLQNFIDAYPNSQYFAEANAALKVLTDKLEKKAFEVAKQYNTVADYKAALVALDNFIADFPGTIYKEEALYYKFDSAYQLAINSVPSKMEERLNNAKIAHANLIKFNGETKRKGDADQKLERIEKDLQQYNKQQ
ncbi:outer membrane protein assembly factor BamD [Flavobacterium caeni]|uniref:Beta-barrel assembly machine subunit BamD n=1 Tax=Flavobacterium caeni TaxID=490189 RepID=A0A1G5BF07_9FLAO|nr:outer membrane protein assembly factor BamD [Flavobacterium caeni]SCX88717.1 Beta-barrel assembly machine subunit BamD [Flavobacterium caeni]